MYRMEERLKSMLFIAVGAGLVLLAGINPVGYFLILIGLGALLGLYRMEELRLHSRRGLMWIALGIAGAVLLYGASIWIILMIAAGAGAS